MTLVELETIAINFKLDFPAKTLAAHLVSKDA